MEKQNWLIEVHFDSDYLWLDKTFKFEIAAEEREAEIFLDAIILGAELKDIKVGGGIKGLE
jgi:hypothetical protein